MSDVRLIFSIQAVRAFLYGFSSILVGASLAASGLSAATVGIVFTAMLLGMAISSIAVGRWGDQTSLEEALEEVRTFRRYARRARV